MKKPPKSGAAGRLSAGCQAGFEARILYAAMTAALSPAIATKKAWVPDAIYQPPSSAATAVGLEPNLTRKAASTAVMIQIRPVEPAGIEKSLCCEDPYSVITS